MSIHEPQIVTAAELGQLFDLSERSIREHRARGRIVRAGTGYDLRRSVLGMLDFLRVEGAKKGRGEMGEPLWRTYEEVLSYRRQLIEERDRLRAGLLAILALPGLPEAAHAAVRDLLDGAPGPEDAG